MTHPSKKFTERVLSNQEVYCMYQSLKMEFSRNYNVAKYGIYPMKLRNRFENEPQKGLYAAIANRYQFENRIASAFASNLVISPTRYVSDIDVDCYRRLSKFNSNSHYYFQEQMTNWAGREIELFKHGKVIEYLGSGIISPELFAVWYNSHGETIDKLLSKSDQSYLWGLVKNRLTCYINYVRMPT